jgi:hypothetical protein
MTQGRRAPGVPQMLCIDGDACSLHEPDEISCKVCSGQII